MNYILLQAAGGSPLGGFLPLLLVLVVVYFFFFRPQLKKQKEEKNFANELSKGMRVVTNSGIHGKILEISDNTLTLESENSRLKIERSAVSKELSKMYLPKEEKPKAEKK
jgi:preprotein translocase subunit YajC